MQNPEKRVSEVPRFSTPPKKGLDEEQDSRTKRIRGIVHA